MTGPELITCPWAWRERLDAARGPGRGVGLVPTMGSLHGGHQSLIRRAAADCTTVGVSVYVNPLQFGAADDLGAYPRDLDRDLDLAGAAGADVVFAPSAAEMWPEPPATTVHVAGLGERGEAAARPGHFDGVATIVAKLFALSGPCCAYFGEKDYQQLAVVKKMVADLSLPIEVIGGPIVRHPDGLAMSSRNAYLDDVQRAVAPTLYWALLAAKRAIEDDRCTEPDAVVAEMERVVASEPAFTLDYATVVDGRLEVPRSLEGEVRLLVAARLGAARLIDNVAAIVPDGAAAAEPFPDPEEG